MLQKLSADLRVQSSAKATSARRCMCPLRVCRAATASTPARWVPACSSARAHQPAAQFSSQSASIRLSVSPLPPASITGRPWLPSTAAGAPGAPAASASLQICSPPATSPPPACATLLSNLSSPAANAQRSHSPEQLPPSHHPRQSRPPSLPLTPREVQAPRRSEPARAARATGGRPAPPSHGAAASRS